MMGGWLASPEKRSPSSIRRPADHRGVGVTILLVVYFLYFLLAGIAGLALYPFVARICFDRFQRYMVSSYKPALMSDLLVSCFVILVCCIFVQFCFASAAALLRAG